MKPRDFSDVLLALIRRFAPVATTRTPEGRRHGAQGDPATVALAAHETPLALGGEDKDEGAAATVAQLEAVEACDPRGPSNPPPPRAESDESLALRYAIGYALGQAVVRWPPTHALTWTPVTLARGTRLVLLGCARCERHVTVEYERDGVEAEAIALARLQAEVRGAARHVGDVEPVARRCS